MIFELTYESHCSIFICKKKTFETESFKLRNNKWVKSFRIHSWVVAQAKNMLSLWLYNSWLYTTFHSLWTWGFLKRSCFEKLARNLPVCGWMIAWSGGWFLHSFSSSERQCGKRLFWHIASKFFTWFWSRIIPSSHLKNDKFSYKTLNGNPTQEYIQSMAEQFLAVELAVFWRV